MKTRIIKLLCLVFSSILVCSSVTACKPESATNGFDGHCKTTEDGFKYYYNENSNEGLCSIGRTKTKSGRAETDKPN